MALFKNRSVLLELKNLPFKEKKKLKLSVTENGGDISFVVNKQCSLIVTSDVSSLSSNRLRSIQKHQTPVVGVDYVYSCVEAGVLLPVDKFKLESSSPSTFSPPVLNVPQSRAAAEPSKGQTRPVDSVSLTQRAETKKGGGNVLEKFRIYTETDHDLPAYPDHFQVAEYSVFEKINSSSWCVLELQSVKGQKGQQYRVVRYWKDDVAKKAAVMDRLVFLSTSEEALEVYQALRDTMKAAGLQKKSSIPPNARDLGSAPLQQLLLEEKLNTGSLSSEVGVFVELLWTEALGCLDNILRVSIDKLSLNDVSRAEGLLLQAQRKLRDASHVEVASLMDEVYTLLPHKAQSPPSAKLISQKLDLCQLIRDILNVSEMTLSSPVPSSLGKYRALRCSIETVPTTSSEFKSVTALLDSKMQIHQVLRVSRGVELQTFKNELGNIKPLLHSSSPSNFVGILSRGLLLPRVGVERHGIERTDIGNLGSGIYFSDAISTSLKYSNPSATDGSRLLLVCDVALGQCKDILKRDPTLTRAPEGHNSVHGVRRTPNTHSEFEDDEYVVYSPDQVKLKYVVQFSVEGEQRRDFSPDINTSDEPCLPPSDQGMGSEEEGIENIKSPLDDVTPGLLDSSGQQLPLQAVHVKCKLMDLLCQVIIFQKYTNRSSAPIEAKYVFPLDDSAAVCGFEAFINGKHVVGQVKEKEKARKEYKQAIEQGHGAYLMDQDAPDVFTISVGNLPPGATVLIKVTFVSELIVKDGSILFSLPGSVAPWQESAALNQTTQVTVEKVCVTDEDANSREFTLDMSIDMPYEITSLQCTTHKVKMKKTECKAVVSVLPGEVMGPEGFQLSVTLSKVHLPRMWVEKHPDKDSQACMLVFYPDFDVTSSSTSDEVVLLLDASESMRGEPLCTAQRIALQVLKTLDRNLRVNVVFFGTDHTQAFLTAQPLVEARQAAEGFIKRSSSAGGSTELWRPLRALSLLPPSSGIRNLLLLSDGHIQNAELTLQLLRDNAQHSRLFTCGLSPTANRHMLRAMAQAGGGAYEFFDTKTKHNWAEKVTCQVKRMASPGCSSVSVKWQQFNPTAPPPVQAPKQLHALFNDCHTLVYGFVPHCTQATLLGDLSGQELKTMVSTSELQKTKGTFLHKLTARALIRDYEDGSLDTNEAEHEGKKTELKSFIIELSKEFSILSQFTSFVAIEERDSEQADESFTDIPKLIAEEDVDFLPYVSWISSQESEMEASSQDSEMENLYWDGEMEDEDFETLFSPDIVSFKKCFKTEGEILKRRAVRCVRSASSGDEDMGFGMMELDEAGDIFTQNLQDFPPSPPPPPAASAMQLLPPSGPPPPAPPPPAAGVTPLGSTQRSSFDEPQPAAQRAHGFTQPQLLSLSGALPLADSLPILNLAHTGGIGRVLRTKHRSRLAIESPLFGSSEPRPGRRVSDFTQPQPSPLSGPPPPPPPAAGVPLMGSAQDFSFGEPQPAAQTAPGFIQPQLLLPSGASRPSAASATQFGSIQTFSFGGLASLPTSLSGAPILRDTPIMQDRERIRQTPQSKSLCQANTTDSAIHGSLKGRILPKSTLTPTPNAAPIPAFQSSLFGNSEPRPPYEKKYGFTQPQHLPPTDPPSLPLLAPLIIGGPAICSSVHRAPVLGRPAMLGKKGVIQQTPLISLDQDKSCEVVIPESDEGRIQQKSTLFPHSVPIERSFSGSRHAAPKAYAWGFTETVQPLSKQPQFVPHTHHPHIRTGSPSSIETIVLHEAQQQCTSKGSSEKQLQFGPFEADEEEVVFGETYRKKRFSLRRRTQRKKMLLEDQGDPYPSLQQSLISVRRSADPELKIKWTNIFEKQHSEGYWEFTSELGGLINFDVLAFTDVFLKSKGIRSLGVKAHADILKLLATLLVLQLMRVEKLEEGKLLRTLFCLEESCPRPERWEQVHRAVKWVCWADGQYPCVYSRLEFGLSWESCTRQLLGFDDIPRFSSLCGLNLRSTSAPLLVH